jgi:hypothetical protein
MLLGGFYEVHRWDRPKRVDVCAMLHDDWFSLSDVSEIGSERSHKLTLISAKSGV